jgi:hypothetical protein
MKNEANILQEKIALLENQQTREIQALREQIHATYESLKPLNFLKNTLEEVSSSPDLKDNILNSVIGLTTGYLSKKVLVGSTHNPFKQLAGTLIQFVIGNVVAKHSETIKAIGEVVLRRILGNIGATKNLNIEINKSVDNQVKQIDY